MSNMNDVNENEALSTNDTVNSIVADKESAIAKINKIGKVGHIVAKITRVFVVIALCATVIGSIACFVLPEDLVEVKVSGNALVAVNLEDIKTLSEKNQNNIRENLEDAKNNGSLSVRGNNYYISNYDVDKNGINIECEGSLQTIDMRDIAKICIIVTVYLTMTVVSLVFISRVCKSLRYCQSPFDADVIEKLQQFAFSLIPWALISSLSTVIIESIFNGGIRFDIGINLGVVAIVLIILGLTYIFKYGAILQQESDETL